MVLTAKQQAFVDVHRGNTTEAATIAGISRGYASQLMMDVAKSSIPESSLAVQEAIKVRNEDNPAIADRQERQEFWTSVQRGDKQKDKAVDIENGIETQVERIPSLAERIKASELLAKSELDFTEKGGDNQAAIIVQINAPGVPIQPLGTPVEQRSLPTGSTEPTGTDTEQGGT